MKRKYIAAMTAALAVLTWPAVPALARGPIQNGYGPSIGFRGCAYYEHEGFQGMRADLGAGRALPAVGPMWNDRISSFICSQGCRAIAFEHTNFAGMMTTYGGFASYVSDAWNDQISSLVINCR